ncbi:MAG: sensor histidine kinase [Marmoricola sp.]
MADAIVSTCDLPPEALVGLRLIQRQTAWMSRLLDSSVDHTPVAVVDLGDTVAEPCSLAPVRSPFEVHFDKLDEAPVLVDPVGLERVARNLMDNATRAVFDGGQVEVRVRAEEQDALLEVADSGPGFGHLAPHQGHGLVGVRRFVDRFGGGLSCGTSWLGGALVTLRLPIAVGW